MSHELGIFQRMSALDLPRLELPRTYGYIAAFLTLRCNLRCPYCINRFDTLSAEQRQLSEEEWLRGLNRIVSAPDLPVTLQGGEPSLHKGFHGIINGLKSDLSIDVLTNLQFDVDAFMAEVPPQRIRREAPYASIRVSYHPLTMKLEPLIQKVKRLLQAGYSVGIWAVRHPSQLLAIETAKKRCVEEGIDFRFKDFLGRCDGKLYGDFKYPAAITGKIGPKVLCQTTELIIGPGGDIYRCHSDLYGNRSPIGHILDPKFVIIDQARPCDVFGLCNPCDVKIKTNRFQQPGHTSVTITQA